MISGDHDDPKASLVGLSDRGLRLWSGRVDNADHAEVDEFSLGRLVDLRGCAVGERTIRDTSGAAAIASDTPMSNTSTSVLAFSMSVVISIAPTTTTAIRMMAIPSCLGHHQGRNLESPANEVPNRPSEPLPEALSGCAAGVSGVSGRSAESGV
jgi:hypothetical protein